jgi:glutamate-1-semialdehyde 2,1-aminomutase
MTTMNLPAWTDVLLLPAVYRRWLLSRAKHPSLGGHVRMSRRAARWVPHHSLVGDAFFAADGASPELIARRRAAFERLGDYFRSASPITLEHTRRLRESLSDLQLTSRYRVPYPFSEVVREHLPVGAFMASSQGMHLRDMDGHAYLDITGSYGVNVMGLEAYKTWMRQGLELGEALGPLLGSYHPCVLDNVERLKRISGMDEVSFHMSGTEAVMQAVRLARYHTGKQHVVRFAGAYNGWWDDVQPGPGNPASVHETYTLRDMHQNTLNVLRSRHDIACVIVNPLQGLHPNKGAPGDSTLVDGSRSAGFDREAYGQWLRDLRAVCTERGIALIMDEIFVGFRVHREGAQAYFGVQADLVCYGKTLAGGYPVGVVCGRSAWMRRFKPEQPGNLCFARGTFNAHPYVMGAMNAFLHYLDTPEAHALYEGVDERWNRERASFNQAFEAAGVPVRIQNLSSIWTVTYTQPGRYHWMYQFYCRQQGLYMSWVGSGRMMFSLDVSDKDVRSVRDCMVAAAQAMQADGWWDLPAGTTLKTLRRRVVREMLAAKWPKLLGWWRP